ncbi:MAG: alpha/beta hydrolase [Candidatus Hodarchaeota archaeon]
MKKVSSKIIPGAGPFYFDGNQIGIIMIHGGGGGTCADLKPLAKDLHKSKGYTIHIPLLPGFGTTPEELRKTSIQAWKTDLIKEINEIREKCQYIILGGHSMGGLLTLIMAAYHIFDGIFTISAPIGIQRFGFKLVPLAKLFMKYHSIASDKFQEETDNRWVGYDKIPINIATKAKKLMKEMIENLFRIKCPTILFQGKLDSEIKKDSMDYIYDNIKSKNKKKIWLENNTHSILNSPDHQIIVSEILKFVDEICP